MTARAALREACGLVARLWVLGSRFPQPMKEYIYVGRRWVMVLVQFNGEEPTPRRRAEDKESDYLAPETDDRAVAKRLEDLTDDRSIHA
jgi:hypothetical protein